MQIRNVKLQFCRPGARRSSVHLTALDTRKNAAEITELCRSLRCCCSKNSPGLLVWERRERGGGDCMFYFHQTLWSAAARPAGIKIKLGWQNMPADKLRRSESLELSLSLVNTSSLSLSLAGHGLNGFTSSEKWLLPPMKSLMVETSAWPSQGLAWVKLSRPLLSNPLNIRSSVEVSLEATLSFHASYRMRRKITLIPSTKQISGWDGRNQTKPSFPLTDLLYRGNQRYFSPHSIRSV